MPPPTSPLVTRDMLHSEFSQFRAEMRADLYRALWILSVVIVAANAGVAVAAVTLAKLF